MSSEAYPVPGGIAPGDINMGTGPSGSHSNAVKTHHVMKLEMWPRNCLMDWDRPERWKRIEEFQIAVGVSVLCTG